MHFSDSRISIDAIWETATLYVQSLPKTIDLTDIYDSVDLGVSMRLKYGFLLKACLLVVIQFF